LYDVAIIGAGINGSSLSYELTNAGKKVLLFDMTSIAGGGSGAAGAFISPKFAKEGELKELLHDAFCYSLAFYEENFSHILKKSPLLHIAQDSASSHKLREYKKTSTLELQEPSNEILKKITSTAKEQEYISLEAGVVNAQELCRALASSAEFVNEKVESLESIDGVWVINGEYRADKVVLATGAYEKLLDEPYINLRGIWGHRVDVETPTQLNYSLHQEVSISSSSEGVVAIGATHNVHYHPQTSKEPYDIEQGREELLKKASVTLELEDVKVIRDYMGLRSGTSDYMPLLGDLVESQKTLQKSGARFMIERSKESEYSYYKNLYIINGSGGYGFVLAPYLAKILSRSIVEDREIDKRLKATRFFTRWAKKELSKREK
jgi:tRNA 5-methylaminomethyl-2-thiouridine biosynthesis bifunctional protein